MVENMKNSVNIDNIVSDKIIPNKTFINKITPYLFNTKVIISIIIIAILFYLKFKYYNKNTNSTKKEASNELYDYVIMDKNNKVWKVSQDFFEKMNNASNYNNLPTTLLNNIKSINLKHVDFNQDKEEFHQKNDADTSDIISDTIANNK